MMRVKIILFALVLVLFGCGHRTAVILDDVETYIQERPDSALATLRAIDTTTLTTKKLQAHYALLHAMALDKNWIDTTDVNVVMPAVRYYDRHPSGDRRAKAWYYLGRIQQNGMDYPAASISLLKAERYAEASIDTSFKVILYLSMGTLYGQSHFPEEALCYSEKAYSLSQATGDTMNANASLFAMAIDLHNVGRYAESDSLYRLLINGDQLDFHLRPTLLCNYALSCVTQKEDYEQAVRLFEEVIGSIGALPKRNYWGAYAYSLERIGKKDQADRLFRKLETKNKDIALSYAHWKSLADAYSEDYPSAYQMLQDAYSIQNDNVKKAFRQSAIKAQKDFLEEMSQESETTARRRLFLAGSAIVGLIIILILIVFFFIRRSRKSAQEKESILEAYNALTSQAEEEKAMVRNQYIHLFKSHFGHLGRMNELLNNFDRNSNDNLYLELKKTIQRIGQDEKSQQLFENMLDDSFDGLMTHFRESFPGKKRRYYQLVSYLFAGFGTATIVSIIPSYNPHNVHVEKSRLKQMIRASDSPYKALFLRLL
jgi:tetratricopeptide (TPR) repeat protein